MKVDRALKVTFVVGHTSRVLHPLEFGVDRFHCSVRDAVAQKGENVFQPPFQHTPCFNHGL